MGKEAGMRAENFFSSVLNSVGLYHQFDNDWYDFRVGNSQIDCQHKVEVKSCQLTIAKVGCEEHKGYKLMCGRFDFTSKESRANMLKENIWIAFVLRYRQQFMLLGFVRAKTLPIGKGNVPQRYLRLNSIRLLRPKDLDDWLVLVR